MAPGMNQIDEGTRLVFQGWSDAAGAERNLTASADPVALVATYQWHYRLSTAADPPEGAQWHIEPGSADGFYEAQAVVGVNLVM